MNDTDRSLATGSSDPAANAASMLLRLGFAIFALVIPCATLMSRWVIVVLVPIGAVLIILSALIRPDSSILWSQARDRAAGPAGVLALLLCLWALASLAWTPFPVDAAEKLAKALGVIVLGFLAVSALPGRMRASNLHLITIGSAIGALLILVASLSELAGQPLLRFNAGTPGRVAVLLTVFVWVGAAWMLIKDRHWLAVGLVFLVFAAISLGETKSAIAPLIIGVLVIGMSWSAPQRVGASIGVALAILVMFAPVCAGILKSMSGHLPTEISAPLVGVGRWWDIAAADPLRMITGRGFDAATVARAAQIIPQDAHVGLVLDIWFDLGLLGALALAGLLYFSFASAARFGLELAPSAMAALASATSFAILERGATQTWWLNGMAVFAIILMSVVRGQYRTVRPRALFKNAADTPANDKDLKDVDPKIQETQA